MLLKGRSPCILTVNGSDTAEIKIEWLHGSSNDAIRIFCSEEESSLLQNGHTAFPAEQIVAAAIGNELHTRGQFRSFDWAKAKEHLRLIECSFSKTPIRKSISDEKTDIPMVSDEISNPEEMPDECDGSPHKKHLFPQPCPCKIAVEPKKIDPFPREFPESEWLRHDYPSAGGSWHYLTGIIYQNGNVRATATAVPGRYNAKPPAWLREFSLFLQNAETHQGYWVAISPFHANSTVTEET